MQRFVITWAPGTGWVEGSPLFEQPYIEEHADHLDELMKQRRIVLSGPFPSAPGTAPPAVGMTVITAPDVASVRDWLATDPAVAHAVLTAEIQPLQIVFEERGEP